MTLGLNQKHQAFTIMPSRSPAEEIISKCILTDRKTFYDLDRVADEIRKHNPNYSQATVYSVLKYPMEKMDISMSINTRKTLIDLKVRYKDVLQKAFGS